MNIGFAGLDDFAAGLAYDLAGLRHARRFTNGDPRQHDDHGRRRVSMERGVRPAEIARQVGVAHQVVSEWRKAWRQGGREALRSAGPAGRKSRLTDAQFAEVTTALIDGAEANGYSTDIWTVPRVAEVIEHITGVAYHPGHVWSTLLRLPPPHATVILHSRLLHGPL
jgi:transposase